MKTMKKRKAYAISVSGETYASLQRVVARGGLQRLVDELIVSGLDDPAFLARVTGQPRAMEKLN